MSWKPISLSDLLGLIAEGEVEMTVPQRHVWDAIKIPPEKWQLHPWGNLGSGFWVVGILGRTVLWFNDIEDGFNRSGYQEHGTISEYWCNQDELQWTVGFTLEELESGDQSGVKLSPPEPVA